MAQKFDVHILGCGSALPTHKHLPSCQVVNVRDKLFMLDCGEGAQLSWRHTGLGWSRLGHVFITHAHGDHVFGLPGLISSMALMGRTAPLHIYAPSSLRPFVQCVLANFCVGMDYDVEFHAVDTMRHALIYDDRSIEVWSLPLQHRVPCCGYLLKEKQGLPHIRREMIDFYGIPTWAINGIKAGQDWQTPDGQTVPCSRLTTPADPVRSYAYCTDTMPTDALPEMIRGVNLLYHEATYADAECAMAKNYAHSTASQAALVAQRAEAGQLMLGHFSARYDDESQLLHEAQSIFPNTILASERMCVAVR